MPNLYFLMGEEPGGEGAAAPAGGNAPAPAAGRTAEGGVNWGGLADDSQEEEESPGDDDPGEGDPEPEPGEQPGGGEGPGGEQETPEQKAEREAAEAAAAEADRQPELTEEQKAAAKAAAEAHREQVLTAATEVYAAEMTEEVVNELLTAPEKVLPKLLAKAALDGAQFAVAQMQSLLPQYIATTGRQISAQEAAVQKFHTAHPDLAAKEHREAVETALKTVQQQVKAKKAKFKTEADAMARVAQIARTIAGLPDPGKAGSEPAAAPVAPHVPVARSRAAGRPAADPHKGNKWAELAEPPTD